MRHREARRRLGTVVLSCVTSEGAGELGARFGRPVTSGLGGRRFSVVWLDDPELPELVARWLTL